VHHRPPRGNYRGRRRAPTPPRSRYAAVVTTAVVGAGVMALATTHSLPDQKKVGYNSADVFGTGPASDLADRQQAADRAGRSTTRAGTTDGTLNQSAPDLWRLPVHEYTPSSGFGWRNLNGGSQFHDGYDMACPEGTKVYAPADGVVTLAGWDGGFGNAVQISYGGGITTIQGHNSRVAVTVGQRVKAGDLVAISGNTGYSFGPHSHFGVYYNNVAIDPKVFMLQRGVDLDRHIEVISGGVL
jgi:murein DD-endopeptidase MepM/ murein hydrolase activator NlpD